MGKLHEILAVEGDLKGKADKILEETKTTFSKKQEHFVDIRKVYHPDDEKEAELVQADESKPMVETVMGKLEYTAKAVADYLDVVYQKENANTEARADLVLEDGNLLAGNVPATVLLGLESKLKNIREVYDAIPTLMPGDDWNKDAHSGHYKAEEKRMKTKKVFKNYVKAAATDKHPAQVDVYAEDDRIGIITTTKVSSALSPLEKSKLLERVDSLSRAVKQARQRANNTEVSPVKIGKKLFDYVNSGLSS